MHSDAATPLNLWKTGCEVYQSCFQCAHLASLPLMSLARDRVTAELPLSLLLEKRELLCGGCGGADILLTSVALTDDADNLLLYRFPYPVGKLMEAENICLELSSKSVYIPYGRDGRDPGRRSHWVDLKAQPQQLAGLPEIAAADEASDRFGGKRAFSRLLQRVNACPGLVTSGCSWESSFYDGSVLTYGYVDVGLQPLGLSYLKDIRQFGERVFRLLRDGLLPGVRYLLTVKLAIFEQRPVFVLDAEAVAAGCDEESAFLLWEHALAALETGLTFDQETEIDRPFDKPHGPAAANNQGKRSTV